MTSTAAASSTSRVLLNDDAAPTPEELTSLTSLLAEYYSQQSTKVNVANLYVEAKEAQLASQKSLETSLLSQAPSFLKLHSDLNKSKELLSELERFLNVFYNDLSTLSTQMKSLQGRSIQIGNRLANRRQLEDKLRILVSGMVMDPKYVDMIFADEASMGKIGLDVWKDCAEKLSSCIRACEALDGTLRDDLKTSGITDIKALQEAKEVIEGCRVMAVTKIRPILISTFSPLRSSLSTNMPVLQSILLKSYRPLYSFLSHHAPRVAIDVQRSYVAASRLYFETGFRRYERSLGRARDRERGRSGIVEGSSSSVSFVEAAKAGGGIASYIPGSSSNSSSSNSDPWLGESSNLQHAKVEGGPAVTLAYLAEDSSHRAAVEALFRSLSLTLLDNGTSEYCFLARFFEGVDVVGGITEGVGGSTLASSISSSSAVKIKKQDAVEEEDVDSDGPLPEESASVQGENDEEEGEEGGTVAAAAREAPGSVVSLSEAEKRRLRGRGAIDGLWKQVMEPVLGTYNSFVASILATQPSLISLYTMLKLNDSILEAVQDRGASNVLQAAFMTFKLKAWPFLQKHFDDVVDSMKKFQAEGTSSTYFLGSFGGFFGGGGGTSGGSAGAGASGGQSGKEAHNTVVRLICTRYARLYSSIVNLNSMGKEEDASIFASMMRLRSEVETILQKADATLVASCHEILIGDLGSGPASVSHSRMQSEISHWREFRRSRLGV